MDTSSLPESPINLRGGQASYLLLAKGQFGSQNLAITWVDCPPGTQQPTHRHAKLEQVYVIVRGSGTMFVGTERRDVGAGTLVFVPADTDHSIRNDGSELLSYVSATSPPFDPSDLGSTFTFERRFRQTRLTLSSTERAVRAHLLERALENVELLVVESIDEER